MPLTPNIFVGNNAMSALARLLRIATSWTWIDLWRIWIGVALRSRQGIGRGVHLGTGRSWVRIHWTGRPVLTRVTLWRRYAAWLPAATALSATPNRLARCAWRDIHSGGHWRNTIWGSPNGRGRKWCAIVLRRYRWPRNDDDLRWRDHRRWSHAVPGLSDHRRGIV
jgi:hypothetical protein